MHALSNSKQLLYPLLEHGNKRKQKKKKRTQERTIFASNVATILSPLCPCSLCTTDLLLLMSQT